MNETLRKLTIDGEDIEAKNDDSLGLDDLLHPAQAFSHPSDVVNDPDLTLNEKRAILASWASDACAIESAPALRRAPAQDGKPVAFDDVMDALRALALDARSSETSERCLSSGSYSRTDRRGETGPDRGLSSSTARGHSRRFVRATGTFA
jgi:hypothetical protein